ncbi:hypothetical protein Pan153_48030 [Gimesia panareensis]|uniref:Uncharacterized protein n=1 Tax=Gimesia panareensis TaxID=2527978 RepID=A0A518FUW5_9PLAN|nr:hypothetical protein Pan153_48030 [Gimesia panareensis]
MITEIEKRQLQIQKMCYNIIHKEPLLFLLQMKLLEYLKMNLHLIPQFEKHATPRNRTSEPL